MTFHAGGQQQPQLERLAHIVQQLAAAAASWPGAAAQLLRASLADAQAAVAAALEAGSGGGAASAGRCVLAKFWCLETILFIR